jgi:hypothetical protein
MGQVPAEHEDGEPHGLTQGNALSRRTRAREDPVWPGVYKALPAHQLRVIGVALNVQEPRLLVTIRHMLAGVFLDQLRTIAGDPAREDVQQRRGEVEGIAVLAASLQSRYLAALSDIMKDHDEASLHSPVGWGPSHFRHDYERLLDDVHRIEQICEDILSSPAFNQGSNKGIGPTGLPAKLSGRSQSWTKEAFAHRLAGLFRSATGRAPTVSGSQDTSFQKFVAACVDIFQASYRELGEPFGPFVPPTRRHLTRAITRHK